METGHFLKTLNDASLASLGFLMWKVLGCIICKNPLWVLSCKVEAKIPVWLPDYYNLVLLVKCLLYSDLSYTGVTILHCISCFRDSPFSNCNGVCWLPVNLDRSFFSIPPILHNYCPQLPLDAPSRISRRVI